LLDLPLSACGDKEQGDMVVEHHFHVRRPRLRGPTSAPTFTKMHRIRLGEHVWRGVLERETMPAWHRANLIQVVVTV
jgi:hypothetical protein